MGRSGIITFLLLLVATGVQAQECDEFFVSSIAGDSITNAYRAEFFGTAPDEWEVHKVALGGLRAENFNGEKPKKGEPLFDYTQELIDIDPAIIVLMLGTNDSLADWENPDHSADFAVYTNSMTSILDRLDEAGIEVILGIPTPMQNIDPMGAKKAAGEVRLEALYRPWLWDEAEFRGLLIVDFYNVIVSYPGWEELFADGVHPYTDDDAGRYLMADAAVDAIRLQYVPEPGLYLSVLSGAIMLAALLKFRAPLPIRET